MPPSINLDEPLRNHIVRDAVTLHESWTIGKSLRHLRSVTLPHDIVYFYVIDSAGKLTGVVPARKLLMSEAGVKVKEVCSRDIISLPSDASVLDACDFFALYRYLAFPVVDADGRFLGTVNVSLFADEIMNVSQKEIASELFQIIGYRSSERASSLVRFTQRFPWLLSNIAGGIICALMAGFYEASVPEFVLVALFVPVVLALSESIGMQSVTNAIQSFHGKNVVWSDLKKSFIKEFPVAFLLGAASGMIVGITALLWRNDLSLALTVFGSITGAMVLSSLVGVCIPGAARLYGRDPKIAAGPIVLAVGDVTTLLIYFNCARILLV